MKQPSSLVDVGSAHLIGIGGSGMSGLAQLLLDRGVRVSGSDQNDSARLGVLREQGAEIRIGHDAANLRAGGILPDIVVITPVIPEDNPELAAARAADLPVASRSQALALVLAEHKVLGIGGTHGKTTTTSMVAVALRACGADPSFAIGSEVKELGSNAHTGTGDYFVVEADESDGAFLRMDPTVVVVSNLEPDHLDYWGDFDSLKQAFADFVDLVRPNAGFAVVCTDQEGSAALVEPARARGVNVVTYGTGVDCDFRIEAQGTVAAGYRFEVWHEGGMLGPVTLRVPGLHNALNATAALAVCVGLGFPTADVVAGLDEFSGAQRRFEFVGEVAGIRFYDDYAHHPTEVAATLQAAREFVADGRLVVAFQAHHYYRTAMFTREFGEALGLADDVVVLEVYAPGEEPIPGATGQAMADHVPLPPEHVVFEPSWSAVAGQLVARARPGDVIMTLGAGSISRLGAEVLAELHRVHSADGATGTDGSAGTGVSAGTDGSPGATGPTDDEASRDADAQSEGER